MLFSVFLISGSVLGIEVTLTRIFSATMGYHFSFLVVSLAVCGLGVGGMLQYFLVRGTEALGSLALGIGIASIASIVILFEIILGNGWDSLPAMCLVVVAPFVFAGAYLAIVLRCYSSHSGWVYGWDLLGSALAIPGVVYCMKAAGPVNALLFAGLTASCVGLYLARRRRLVACWFLVALATVASNIRADWLDIPPIPSARPHRHGNLFAILARNPDVEIVHSTWGPYTRTDVVRHRRTQTHMNIYTNGNVPAVLPRLDPRTRRYAVPSKILMDVPFQWKRPGRVLSIGPGGGLDLVLAKMFGATRIDGVEVNPAIPGILSKYRWFGGDPYRLPGVHVEIGDGRTYVARSEQTYDLVIMALTKAGTGSRGSGLVEDYLYTIDAVEDYQRILSENGLLAFITDTRGMGWRFFHTAALVLQREGLSPSQILDHVAIVEIDSKDRFSNPYSFLLLVSKNRIESSGARALNELTERLGYSAQFIPGVVEGSPFALLRNPATTLGQYIERLELRVEASVPTVSMSPDLRPVTDDSPYFSNLSSDVPDGILPLVVANVVILSVFTPLVLLTRRRRLGEPGRKPSSTRWTSEATILTYFVFLGVAFMSVEIALIQKLILILGHPTRALSVALLCILLGGGVGSLLSQRLVPNRLLERTGLACVLVAVLVASSPFLVEAMYPTVLRWSLPARILSTGMLCGLLGMVMGMPFPLGVRRVGPTNADLIPWIWGVNGLSSVLGGSLTVIGSKFFGFHFVLLASAALYGIASFLPRSFGILESGEA